MAHIGWKFHFRVYVVVSLNQGTPISYGDPQKGTPIFGKHPSGLRLITRVESLGIKQF